MNHHLGMEERKPSDKTGEGHYQCQVPHINWEMPVKLGTGNSLGEKTRDTEWYVGFDKGQHKKLDGKTAYSGPKYTSNNRGLPGRGDHRNLNGSGSYR